MLISNSQLGLAQYMHQQQTTLPVFSESLESIIENGVGAIFLRVVDHKVIPTNIIANLEKADKHLKIIHNLQLQFFMAVFTAFQKANIEFMVLKGWALSYEVYLEPHHRPKTDIDIIIAPKDKDKVKAVLQQLHFSNPRGWEPKAIINQFTMRKPLIRGIYANIDIHLKISDDKLIQEALNWDRIFEGANKNTKLNATIPSKNILLLHAVVHLLLHYSHGDLVKLVWLYDIHLIIQAMCEHDADNFIVVLKQTGLSQPVSRVLKNVIAAFPSKKCQHLAERVGTLSTQDKFAYMLEPPSLVRSYFRKLHQTKGLKAKTAMIGETLFPPKEELYRKYGKVSRIALPFYYVHRILHGLIQRVLK